MALLRAVIIDWGGVLTQPIRDSVRDWIDAERIDWDSYLAAVVPWLNDAYESAVIDEAVPDAEPAGPGAGPARAAASALVAAVVQTAGGAGARHANPVHALERGECTAAEFEAILAARLVRTDGQPVRAAGLLTRMLAAGRPVPAMYELIRELRARGVRTALLSNSWGPDGYPREDFPGLFDAVVISGEVGMRKPEPRIFLHTAGLLDVPPADCAFVDDLLPNVDAAAVLGMTGVHHADPATTRERLRGLFPAHSI